MKNSVKILIGILVVFVIILFTNRESYTERHPTLSQEAERPDQYMKNASDYAEVANLNQSATNLEKAIASIWKLEKDVDALSFNKLEQTIKDLEQVHHDMIADSLKIDEMRQAFEYALDNLARSELEISEKYADTHQMDKANIALKYAQLHIKNAMLFHRDYFDPNAKQLAMEKRILERIEELEQDEAISPVEYVLAVDRLIEDVDNIIAMK